MNNKQVSVISLIIKAESEKMKKVNLDALAERINRLIQGEKVEALNTENEHINCTCCGVLDPEVDSRINIGPSPV
ncbi:hypothetical protein ACU5CE_27425 [Priestia megaterium]|uniref:hypothetical protein n=1 Tax=Priestia megaterium TaxID=1404 RepID=UPI00406BCF40